jgi:hypothetical protein
LRSTAAACSEGGRVEFDDGGVTMTKSLRKRTAVARSETGVDAATCSEAGDEVAAWSRARIGGGDTTVARVTTKRERAWGRNVVRESAGHGILLREA